MIRESIDVTGSGALSMESSLQAVLKEATGQERSYFDFRGFLAGFALSAAIGAALYMYLMAG